MFLAQNLVHGALRAWEPHARGPLLGINFQEFLLTGMVLLTDQGPHELFIFLMTVDGRNASLFMRKNCSMLKSFLI